jgi:hypothetical protein
LYVLALVGAFVAGVVSGVVSGGVSDDLLAVATVGVAAVYILCAIAAGFWIYNAACNVRSLGARGLEVSPGWAVGFYAIPIAAWFKPFQGMDEIDRASRAPENWRGQKTRVLLRLWWTAWLIAGIGGSILNIVQRVDVDDAGAAGLIGIASIGLMVADLAAAALFFAIVLSIHRAQTEARTRGRDLAQVFA